MRKAARALLFPLLAVALALAIGAVLIALQGKSPLVAYGYLLQGAFGNRGAIAETLIKATPLIFTGLAVAVAYRSGVFNIGAEGQLLLGALGATWAGVYLHVPVFLALPLSLLAGFAGGALWGAIPGYLKARKGLNEIINTILLNYVAVQVVSYFVTGPMKEPPGYYPQTAQVSEAARLANILPGTRLHAGLVLALVAAALVTTKKMTRAWMMSTKVMRWRRPQRQLRGSAFGRPGLGLDSRNTHPGWYCGCGAQPACARPKGIPRSSTPTTRPSTVPAGLEGLPGRARKGQSTVRAWAERQADLQVRRYYERFWRENVGSGD